MHLLLLSGASAKAFDQIYIYVDVDYVIYKNYATILIKY